MKKLLFVGATLISGLLHSQISVYECTPENSTMTQLELLGPESEINKPCAWFDSPVPYIFTGNQQKTIHATNEIHIKSNFHAKPVGNGELHLGAGNKGLFEVVCMNYPDMLHVLKYKKFELGITLPEGIKQKVENFVTKANVPGNEKINPYLDFNMRIECEFKHPQIPYSLSVDAFYNKEYESWMNEIPEFDPPKGWWELENTIYTNYDGIYNQLGGYNEIPSEYPFLARFAPPRLGKWQCVVHIYVDNNNIQFHSDPFYFTVIESGSPGLVRVANDSRTFELGGQPFYPLGANILWPQTVITQNNPDIADEKLVKLLTTEDHDNDGVYEFLSEEYRHVKPLPILFDKWRNHAKNIADNGGNFVRMIMHPFSSEIEFEERGNYTDRLYIAQELDEFLEYCESRGLYIDWNMMVHYTLQSNNYYKIAWDQAYQDKVFDYKNISGMNNDPDNFFTLPEAKYYFKQKMRYIISRWGYSTNPV